jgi:hypothetical protein
MRRRRRAPRHPVAGAQGAARDRARPAPEIDYRENWTPQATGPPGAAEAWTRPR